MQAKKFLATLLAVTMTAAPTVPYPVSAAETEVHGENDRQVQEEEQSAEETTQTEDTEQEIQLNEEFLQILSKTAVWDGDSVLIDVVSAKRGSFPVCTSCTNGVAAHSSQMGMLWVKMSFINAMFDPPKIKK